MTASVKTAGVWKTLMASTRVGGVWTGLGISSRVASVWKAVGASAAGAFSCVAAPTTLYKRSAAHTEVSEPVTVTPSGGTGPYTYAWSLVSGDAPPKINCDNPTAATTRFTALGFYPELNAVYRCLVTDSGGLTATALVAMTFSREGE